MFKTPLFLQAHPNIKTLFISSLFDCCRSKGDEGPFTRSLHKYFMLESNRPELKKTQGGGVAGMCDFAAESLRWMILVIEDDPDFSFLIREILETEGYDVHIVANANAALAFLDIMSPHLILSSLYLPDMHGLELRKQLKLRDAQIPVLFFADAPDAERLIAEGEVADCLSKPVRIQTFLERVRSQLDTSKTSTARPFQNQINPALAPGNPPVSLLKIDLVTRKAWIHGCPLHLTEKEFDLLMVLAASPEQVFSRIQLLQQVWDKEEKIAMRTIDSHMSHLRKKMSAISPRSYPWIYAQRGSGYFFKPFLSLSQLQRA